MNTAKHWLLPRDATKEEKAIFLHSVEQIYNHFDDPLDKLIIALSFELDYPQVAVGRIIGREEVAVSLRVKKIRTILSKTYKAFLKP
jgi:hypothetical protein